MQKYILVILLFFSVSVLHAQKSQTDSLAKAEESVEKKYDFSLMPFLSYNRNLKFMIGAIPMVMYKTDQKDTISPKSLSGLSAVYTTNGSYFFAFFNKLFFDEDNWRVKLFAVTGDHYSQFYMDDQESSGFYDYGTNTTIFSLGAQRKIIPGLYGGISYTYSHYDTEYEDDVQPASTTITNGLDFNFLYDTRDEIYYPTQGSKSNLKWITYPEWFGNDVAANKVVTEYHRYISMRENTDVLAARFSAKFGLGDIAFEQQETIGGKDIRGYSEGKYRGDGLVALQGEYRYNFNPKMGLVGFAGLATIYGSDNTDFNWKLYPGAGVGYRYRAFKDVKFNIGLDAAVGKDDWGIYFRIGEAF
ncbi:BamA/TamA family outer membrane protein [Echinicola sp. CAU 1574]|uniref:BamA/TamA family outer membrane protein n=1 Tax=Echinicola arenosa TaxID=2774144 RepID=A0ABR9AJW3_9BACT|nr:BamA/TamA family outer membrane protein [Echinicola arenosa]MBD8488829.1 BamA/TamA family outer membrane protein [Echinicola arenosa]